MKTILAFLTISIIALIYSNRILSEENNDLKNELSYSKSNKVTGIRGVFFKSKDPKALNEWYYKNLVLAPNDYGSIFAFRKFDKPEVTGYLQWSPFKESTKYFIPSEKDFMINYRVENMDELVKDLKTEGVTFTDTVETYEYGKFVHIMDPEGNKIELWEPVDTVFTNLYEEKTTY